MTHLRCSVYDCVNHKDNLCCRPAIDVKGEEACECNETCCGSFHEKFTNATNGAGFTAPNERLEILCEAKTCVYNTTGKCTAADVKITNGSNGTECGTFRIK